LKFPLIGLRTGSNVTAHESFFNTNVFRGQKFGFGMILE
jgi:hypothetical protein